MHNGRSLVILFCPAHCAADAICHHHGLDPDRALDLAPNTFCIQQQNSTMTDYKKDTSTAAAAVPESELTLQEVMKQSSIAD
jgi:hypothetical protein